MNKKNSYLQHAVLSVMLLGILGTSPQALAHKLNLFAYAEQGTVSVEGYFADGRKAQNSAVKVMDSSGKVLVEGVTDGQGRYSFNVPQKSDLTITVNAGMGHQGEFKLSADELDEGSISAEAAGAAHESETQESGVPVVGSELDVAVHRAVNEAIKPLVRELAESRQKASLTQIIGAIGYLFGIFGLFAYYKARQMSQSKGGQ